MNNVSFGGRLTADPDEPSVTNSGRKVLDLRVAINHPRRAQAGQDPETPKVERPATFVTVRCWERTAENVRQYLERGALVGVSGSLESVEWHDRETGEKSHKVYVSARGIDFLERRLDQAAAPTAESVGAGVEPF